jgi:Uma2 family endonuclease
MGTGTLVSVEEYLSTSYRPDREYVDGVVLERNLGEDDHSSLQTALAAYFSVRQKQWNIRVRVEQRVQVLSTRFRVPDLCVVLLSVPREPIITKPPFICIEILSKNDTVESMQERIDDYLAFGVSYVWVINPRSRRAFVHTTEGSHEAKDGTLRTENPELIVPLAEVFDSIA